MFKTHWPVLGGGGVLLLLTGVIGPVLFFAASWIPQTEDSYGSSHLLGDSSPCQAPIATGLELWQWTLDCRNAENLNGGGGGCRNRTCLNDATWTLVLASNKRHELS